MKLKALIIISPIVILAALFLVSVLSSIKQPPKNIVSFPTPTFTPIGRIMSPKERISPIQQVIIGQTTDEEIMKIPGVKLIKSEGDTKEYEIPSVITSRPHAIKTSGGVAQTERLTLPAYDTQDGYATLSELAERFGAPTHIFSGSSFYGDFADRYIYESSGFSAVVNKNTNEVYEIFHFTPMSYEEYSRLFPEEIIELEPHREIY